MCMFMSRVVGSCSPVGRRAPSQLPRREDCGGVSPGCDTPVARLSLCIVVVELSCGC